MAAIALAVMVLRGTVLAVPERDDTCREPVVRTEQLSTGARTASSSLTIVSLNMAREIRLDAILRDLTPAGALAGADVWLLQEAAERTSESRTIVDLARALQLNYAFAPIDLLDDGALTSGLAVLSRYPILETRVLRLTQHDLKFHTRCRIALQVEIDGPFGGMRLFNVHLDTRITKQQRLEQLTPVLDAAGAVSGPVVVAGDFNTSNVRWFWNLLPIPFSADDSTRVRQAFRDRGFASPIDGHGRTLDVGWVPLPLRLDWIFPRGVDPISSGLSTIPFSDHRAVWVQLNAQTSS